MRAQIINVIRNFGPLTQKEIARKSGLNNGSINLTLRKMTNNELIRFKVDGRSYYYDLIGNGIPGNASYVPVNTENGVYDVIKEYVRNHNNCSKKDVYNNVEHAHDSHINILISQGELRIICDKLTIIQ